MKLSDGADASLADLLFLLGRTDPTGQSRLTDLLKWMLSPWSPPARKPISAEWKRSPYPFWRWTSSRPPPCFTVTLPMASPWALSSQRLFFSGQINPGQIFDCLTHNLLAFLLNASTRWSGRANPTSCLPWSAPSTAGPTWSATCWSAPAARPSSAWACSSRLTSTSVRMPASCGYGGLGGRVLGVGVPHRVRKWLP